MKRSDKRQRLVDVWNALDWGAVRLGPRYNAVHIGSPGLKVSYRNIVCWYLTDLIVYCKTIDAKWRFNKEIDSYNLAKSFMLAILEVDPEENASLLTLLSATFDVMAKALARQDVPDTKPFNERWARYDSSQIESLISIWIASGAVNVLAIDYDSSFIEKVFEEVHYG